LLISINLGKDKLGGKMDKKKIEEAVKLFLEGIGENVTREGLLETPRRIADMCEELFGGMNIDAYEHLQKTFSANNNELILEKDITFYSVCEHHLLPFYGKAHIAYIPDNQVLGLSKLARTVEIYSKRPQIQEQMTAQIADDIMKYLKPKGVMVLLEAEHMCMTMRGVRKPGTLTTTYVVRGEFEENPELRNTFFNLIRN
jgi:GTP cyclohydrolase I